MTDIARMVLKSNLPTIFSCSELRKIMPENNIRRNQVRKAVLNNELTKVSHGLYTLSKNYRKDLVDVYSMSNKIDKYSYVSMMTALRNADWIPEAVYICFCVSTRRQKRVQNSFATIDYVTLRQKKPFAGVVKVNYFGEDFYQAKPLKALCDYHAYINSHETDPLSFFDSLRIDTDEVKNELTLHDFYELDGNYTSYPDTLKFIANLKGALFYGV